MCRFDTLLFLPLQKGSREVPRILLQICDHTIDPSKDLGLFLGLNSASKERNVDVKDLVDYVGACLGKDLLEVLGGSLVTVNHQRNVLSACLGQLAAEKANGIAYVALCGNDQNNDSFLITRVSRGNYVNGVESQLALSLDHISDLINLLLSGRIENSHFNSHDFFLQKFYGNGCPYIIAYFIEKWNVFF